MLTMSQALFQELYTHCLIHSSQELYVVGTTIIPILQAENAEKQTNHLRIREEATHGQDYLMGGGSRCEARHLNSGVNNLKLDTRVFFFFLNLRTSILGRTFVVGNYHVCCGMFGSMPRLYQLDTSSTQPLQVVVVFIVVQLLSCV